MPLPICSEPKYQDQMAKFLKDWPLSRVRTMPREGPWGQAVPTRSLNQKPCHLGEGPWGQAVPTRSLNQKPCHLGEFRFSNPKVRPDPVFGPSAGICLLRIIYNQDRPAPRRTKPGWRPEGGNPGVSCKGARGGGQSESRGSAKVQIGRRPV